MMTIKDLSVKEIVNSVKTKLKPLIILLFLDCILAIIASPRYVMETLVNIVILEGGGLLVLGGIISLSKNTGQYASAESSPAKNSSDTEKEQVDQPLHGINPPKEGYDAGRLLLDSALILLVIGFLIDLVYRAFFYN